MKQIKFRHLATLGLCCSLLANSFTGITAIAETVTIESSPTAETVASETTETEKKTKVEQTEQTKEAKNQQEHKETEATSQDTSEENNQKEVAQPTEATTSSLEKNLPKIESRGIPLKTVVYPKVQYDFVDETGAPFTTPLSFSGNYIAQYGGIDGAPVALPAPYNKLSAQANGTGSYILSINNNEGFPLTPQMIEKYGINKYFASFVVDKLRIVTSLKFVDSIKYASTSNYWPVYIYKGHNITTGIFDNSIEDGIVEEYTLYSGRDGTFKINTLGSFEIVQPHNLSITSGGFPGKVAPGYESILLRGFDGTNTIKTKLVYKVTRKQVTEKFVDGTGVAITPPTGFTQNKKTPMTNNNFTYTSAKALPDTYQANGKTYKFKGWYKGKTKPATLKTTKTPSYAVTYDNNDDLNVVYEETSKDYKFPSSTVNFQFVNEAGTIISPTPFTITTDLQQEINSTYTKLGSITGTNSGNTKQVTIPAKTIRADVSLGGVNNYGTTNTRITIPKFYENISLYTGNAYTQATLNEYLTVNNALGKPVNNPPLHYGLSKVTATQFKISEVTNGSNYRYSRLFAASNQYNLEKYYTPVGTIYYQLTNRKVTENFVDASGTKITPPTGFTQGKQTVINSDLYTFKQSGTLPDTYKANDKTYKFKGWYKGKTKPTTLKTTKTPSYAVTYDNNDDLNVVYEVDPAKDYKFPSKTVNFQFVNEAGTIISPTPFTITTDLQQEINSTYTKLGSITGTNSGNTKQVTIPAKTIRADVSLGGVNNYGTTNTRITIPKFYENISLYTGNAYTQATLNEYLTVNNALGKPVNNPPLHYGLSKVTATQFKISEVTNGSNYRYSRLFAASNRHNLEKYFTPVGTIYYQLTNRKVTENFVDARGTKITPPTGFTQGNQIPMTSDTFKYTAAKALPTSYTADGKTYLFQGWYKGKTKPNTLTTSTTPTYDTTFDDNDDMTAVYKEASISANLTMRGAVDVVDNGGTMEYWEVLLKNTGEAPLTSIKIKPTTDWESGISTPTELFILGTGQNTKVRPITKEQWEAGFEIPLDKSLPVGGQLTINLIGTKVTGQPNQVLKAAVEVSGNFNKLTASDTVRIKDLDQETKEPTGEGFISVPTFDFGQVGVASVTKQHGLKKAADYYGNGTRNPYVRISKTQPNWSLTAQLSQPKSATDSLPTATRLLLGAAPVSSFSNYNQPTELKNAIGTTNAINLTANNAATSIIANQQFTGSDVYQLDFTFDNIKLEVPANQGTAGQQYQAAVTWNLVTGP
ncbi:hypothetical protein IGL07_002616 [Enterococcus sp. DIV1368f]